MVRRLNFTLAWRDLVGRFKEGSSTCRFIRLVSILGKTTFHLVALGDKSKVLLKKKFTQKQLIDFTANLQTSLIGMEACSGAHFLGRALRAQGHDVKLLPAQFVKPFVKSNKNDFIDAEAIAEAVDRRNMRFVPIKTDDQLDLQALHRVRDRLMVRRTSVINQLRAFLLERGLVFAKSPVRLREAMPDVLENANENLTPRIRNLIAMLWNEWKQMELQVQEMNEEIERIASSDAACCGRRQSQASNAVLAEIVLHAITIYEPRCSAAGIKIRKSFESSRAIVVRRGEMMQVISNLIANSISAMPSGGVLSVSVEDAAGSTDGIVLTVQDDGVGIAAEYLPKVFDAFFTTRSTVGTGIGLFVAKQFVEGHGGHIEIQSSNDPEDHGTSVRIFLPISTPYDASLA